MAGVIGKRLRLTTSRKPSYRRGGVAIGSLNAPTYIERDDVTLEQALAIVRDPNIAIAVEDEDGGITVVTEEDRETIAEGLETEIEARASAKIEANGSTDPAQRSEPNTAEPQGGEVAASAEASQAGGHTPTADGSDASAGDAATNGLLPGGGDLSTDRTEPTAQTSPAAPEPAAKPKPASRGGGKAKGTAA